MFLNPSKLDKDNNIEINNSSITESAKNSEVLP